jgi:hypothetical protein
MYLDMHGGYNAFVTYLCSLAKFHSRFNRFMKLLSNPGERLDDGARACNVSIE